jgi:hypothetical protein
MKSYWIMWTYIANHSTKPIKVQAATPEDAVQVALGFYSEDFHEKGSFFVFDSEPVLQKVSK